MTVIMVCVVVVQFDFFFFAIIFLQERFLEMQLLVPNMWGFFLIGAQNWEEPFPKLNANTCIDCYQKKKRQLVRI